MLKSLAHPYILLTLNMMVWSGNWIIGRGLRAEFTPLGLSFWRWTVAGLILLVLIGPRLWRKRHAVRRDWLLLSVLAILGIALFNMMVYQALQTTTAINAVLIISTQPIGIIIMAWLIDRIRVTGRTMAGTLIALAGVFLILVRGDLRLLLELHFSRGDLWGLAAVPIWAVYSVLLRRRPPELNQIELLSVLVMLGAAFQLPFYLYFSMDAPQMVWHRDTYLAVAYTGTATSLLGHWLWNNGVAQVGPNTAGSFLYLVPLFTAVLAILILGEAMHLYHVLSMAMIITGIWLATRTRRR